MASGAEDDAHTKTPGRTSGLFNDSDGIRHAMMLKGPKLSHSSSFICLMWVNQRLAETFADLLYGPHSIQLILGQNIYLFLASIRLNRANALRKATEQAVFLI